MLNHLISTNQCNTSTNRARLAGLCLAIVGGLAGLGDSTAMADQVTGWGINADGELDNLPQGDDFIAVAGGEFYSLALRSNGAIEGWGSNFNGQLNGLPTTNDFVAIAAWIQP